jgi:hypothetical protein
MNQCVEGQGFGANFNPSYGLANLEGHTGQDWACGFGTPIHSPYDGLVYKVLTKDNPSNDGTGFTGVFMIVDDGIELFEFLVGHCDPTVAAGTRVKKGDIIGTEANHGLVYSGNIQITLAMQHAGDTRGHHRHYQKRPVSRSKTIAQPALSAYNDVGGTYTDAEGFYYPIFNYNNGFHGCVDPSAPTFGRDLTFGCQGYDVYVLQRFLVKQGFFHTAPTGYFGEITGHALADYQATRFIKPTLGYFGPITREIVAAAILPAPDLTSA